MESLLSHLLICRFCFNMAGNHQTSLISFARIFSPATNEKTAKTLKKKQKQTKKKKKKRMGSPFVCAINYGCTRSIVMISLCVWPSLFLSLPFLGVFRMQFTFCSTLERFQVTLRAYTEFWQKHKNSLEPVLFSSFRVFPLFLCFRCLSLFIRETRSLGWWHRRAMNLTKARFKQKEYIFGTLD